MSWENSALWSIRDEQTYNFLEQKYKNRAQLTDAADAARKLADKSQTIDGRPNPHHPLLEARADMCQLRLEMAYLIERNAYLQGYIETLENLHQRVAMCEGAYSHTKMLAENCRIDYALVKDALTKIHQFLKEQKHDPGKA